MTNEQYFKSLLGFGASAELIEGALIDAELTGSSTYVKANSIILKRAAINALQMLLSTPDKVTGTGETTNSTKYDRDAILKRIKMLQEELGEGLPTIRGVHVW